LINDGSRIYARVDEVAKEPGPQLGLWDTLTQVQALLCSIDRSEPYGLRDFTLLYLAAAYGLRSGELVRLTLGMPCRKT
jgi:site-specific recombinase XerD